MAREVLVVHHNHFDPTWRRCYDRPAVYNGVTVRSYAEVEELCIDRFLELADQGYTYALGQVAVLRKYLERNPERRAEVQRQIQAGRFTIVQAGEVIQDSVLPTAEGLVRNFLLARPFYRELAGEGHRGLKLAWLMDAFGNSPNYPQLLAGVGADTACHLTYRRLDESVWVGIDGSKVFCYDEFPTILGGCFDKHPPCPDCQGSGCEACRQTGLEICESFPPEHLRQLLHRAVQHQAPTVRLQLVSEEVPPDPQLIALIAEYNRHHEGVSDARFAGPCEVRRAGRGDLQRAWLERDLPPSKDLNPAMPGCLVTRIALKQRNRAIAYQLVRAEAALASRSWAKQTPEPPPAQLTEAWRDLVFTQFHDAITGTLIDSAAAECHEMLDRAEAAAEALLPAAEPAPEPTFREAPGDERATVEFGRFRIAYDRTGICRLWTDGQDLCGQFAHLTRRGRPYRIGELTLEADFGDAWGTRIDPGHRYGLQLGDEHTSVAVADGALRWTGRYTGGDPKIDTLAWTVTVRPSPCGQRLDFTTEVDWDTANARLRVYFPVASQATSALYEVPFGHLERAFDPARFDYSQWQADHQEYPTLHWAAQPLADGRGVVVLNRGLPCYRWEPGRFDLSLLRSPQWHFCIVEPAQYEFWDIDGQRDSGHHRFEYALWPVTDGFDPGTITRHGYDYNRGGALELPFTVSGDVVVTAWKPAEDGRGWILRLQEAAGRGTCVVLDFPEPCRVGRCNLLEDDWAVPVRARRHFLALHRHGLLTLRLEPRETRPS